MAACKRAKVFCCAWGRARASAPARACAGECSSVCVRARVQVSARARGHRPPSRKQAETKNCKNARRA
eukprot:1969262-Alexandrium_andersonii.AAC.1